MLAQTAISIQEKVLPLFLSAQYARPCLPLKRRHFLKFRCLLLLPLLSLRISLFYFICNQWVSLLVNAAHLWHSFLCWLAWLPPSNIRSVLAIFVYAGNRPDTLPKEQILDISKALWDDLSTVEIISIWQIQMRLVPSLKIWISILWQVQICNKL